MSKAKIKGKAYSLEDFNLDDSDLEGSNLEDLGLDANMQMGGQMPDTGAQYPGGEPMSAGAPPQGADDKTT